MRRQAVARARAGGAGSTGERVSVGGRADDLTAPAGTARAPVVDPGLLASALDGSRREAFARVRFRMRPYLGMRLYLRMFSRLPNPRSSPIDPPVLEPPPESERTVFDAGRSIHRMKVIGVAGPSDSGKTTSVAALAGRLRERGTVATVKHLTHEPDVDTEGKDTARHRAGGAAHTVGLTDEGTWFATGEGRTLADVLGEFSRTYDYAIVEGFSGSDLPKVVLGDRAVEPPIVARAANASDLDVEEVLRAVETLPKYEP